MRVRNRYVLELLVLIARLGRRDVSATLLIEAWRELGRDVDDQFVLHYETLFDYQFVERTDKVALTDEPADQWLTLTAEGANFLERYY